VYNSRQTDMHRQRHTHTHTQTARHTDTYTYTVRHTDSEADRETNVFTGAVNESSCNKQWVFAALNHTSQPVDGSTVIRATD